MANVEERVLRLESSTQDIKVQIARLEGASKGQDDLLKAHQTTLTKLLLGFMALVAALAGKESILAIMKGSTLLDHINFVLLLIGFFGLGIGLVAVNVIRKEPRPLLIGAGGLFLLAGFLRASEAAMRVENPPSLVYTVPFLMGSALTLVEGVLLWRHR